MKTAIKTSWQTATGQIECRWSETGSTLRDLSWLRAESESRSSYLQPLPDFASHSPFGGAYWFQPIPLIAFFE